MSSIWDAEELARHLCGLPDSDEETDIDKVLMEKFDVDLPQFSKIVDALLPLCVIGSSPLTGKTYQGFAVDGRLLMKQEIEQAST